jgi:adenylosuccinate synthase
VIEYLPGWSADIRAARGFDELPDTARDYIGRIESLLGASVSIVGLGPERSQYIVRGPVQKLFPVPAATGA